MINKSVTSIADITLFYYNIILYNAPTLIWFWALDQELLWLYLVILIQWHSRGGLTPYRLPVVKSKQNITLWFYIEPTWWDEGIPQTTSHTLSLSPRRNEIINFLFNYSPLQYLRSGGERTLQFFIGTVLIPLV